MFLKIQQGGHDKTMRNKVIFVLLVLVGLFFTYKGFISNGALVISVGYLFVALVAFIEGFIVLKRK